MVSPQLGRAKPIRSLVRSQLGTRSCPLPSLTISATRGGRHVCSHYAHNKTGSERKAFVCHFTQPGRRRIQTHPGQWDCKVGPFLPSSAESAESGGRKRLKVKQFSLNLPRVVCTLDTLLHQVVLALTSCCPLFALYDFLPFLGSCL